MMRSLYAAVSGLRSHQLKLDVIGNNIANINTIGYKGGRATFSEALTQMLAGASRTPSGGYTNPMQVGLGMSMGAIDTQFSQGSLQATGNTTDLAIQGNGFFVLKNGDQYVYSRAGAFSFDVDGRLVNMDGLPVQGWMINEGNNQTSLLGNLTLGSNLTSNPEVTSQVWLSGNLNSGLKPQEAVWSLSDSLTISGNELDSSDLSQDLVNIDQFSDLVGGETVTFSGTDTSGNPVSTVFTYSSGATLQDLLDFITSAYSGATASLSSNGSLQVTADVAGETQLDVSISTSDTVFVNLIANNSEEGKDGTPVATQFIVYDSTGNSYNLTIEFTQSVVDGAWTWEVKSNDSSVNGGTGTASFDTNGNLLTFETTGELMVINGKNVRLKGFDSDGKPAIHQFASPSNINIESDGHKDGTVTGVTIGADGSITVSFTNGENVEFARIALAHFTNTAGLVKVGEGMYEASASSGDRNYGSSQSTIVSGALEMSNVDLVKEFTEMITTQKGFQASARVISTVDQILEEVVRLKR